jgi:ribosomal protein L16 Arg81 hydroxylase
MQVQEPMKIDSPVSDDWKAWIAENKMLGVIDQQVLDILICNGIDRKLALDELRSASSHPYVRAGDRLAQRLRKLESLLNIRGVLAGLSAHSGTIERKSNVSREDFLEDYYSMNRPVILLDAMCSWRALSAWTPDYLKATCGNAAVEVMTRRNTDRQYEINLPQHREAMRFAEYVEMVTNGDETNDYYLVANNHMLQNPEFEPLLGDIEPFPEYLAPETWAGRVFLWYGPAGTLTPLHHDVGNIFMAQVRGRKRITLIAPYQTHFVYNDLGVFSAVDCEKPDYVKHPLFAHANKIEVVLEPGEVLFLPVGWWHHVRALDVSITVSFMNFVFPNEYCWFSPAIEK